MATQTARVSQWPLVARALLARGRTEEALAAWRKAVVETPDHALGWATIALMLSGGGAASAPILPARIAVSLAPGSADALVCLGSVLALGGRKADAARTFRRGLSLAPGNAIAQARNGHLAAERGEPALGLGYLRRAVALDPLDGASWAAVAWWHFLVELGYDRMERSLRRGLAATPGSADLLARLGELFRDLGDLDVSIRFYDRAIAAEPSVHTERALLLALLYAPDRSEDEHFRRHVAFARRHAPAHPRPPLAAIAGRRIRLGYLSSGFFDYPTAALTVGMIEAHDRARFEVSLFAHVPKLDAMSRRLKAAADHWIDVLGLAPQAIAGRIRAAGIDILVHPAGRHDPIIWPVAALRPAPVQVALYEAATTGMDAFDLFVTDRILHPPHGSERMVERLLRIPSLPLHELPAEAPAVTPLPALAAGRVTFGSLNNSAKLNDGVLALWARTVAAVPGSRMLIKSPALASSRLAGRVLAAFAAAGVESGRIDLMTGYLDSRREMLDVYGGIDIGLDTFPFAGGMTTFEAMCQGVPVVTLLDRHLVGRWGATLAVHAGHPGLVAKTPAEFVAIARRLAGDVPGLAALRAGLRDDFVSSPLCDGRLQARHLERAYRHILRRV